MLLRSWGPAFAALVSGLVLSACNKQPDTTTPEPATAAADKPADAGDDKESLEDPEESPYLDSSNFNDEVEKHLGEIVGCYRETVGKPADAPQGRVRVTVLIDSQGQVKDVTYDAQRSTLKDDPLQACITGKVKAWRFNISLTGADTPMPYTFDLSASGLLKQ
ncbi:MAG: AgmX/PglI C-terminal domain-containing protein [Myxococcales bacterium]|nr:AgmX/PglI C-terminal domain-containing protein [Myxococcales bacterium]